jgi:hypothetical protein
MFHSKLECDKIIFHRNLQFNVLADLLSGDSIIVLLVERVPVVVDSSSEKRNSMNDNGQYDHANL